MSTAKLSLNGQEYEFPVIEGSEHEVAIDFTKLRAQTGAISYDPGYGNTGSCKSAITFIDGEKGILRYRGYPIEQLAEHSNFVEVCYLTIYGKLPSAAELAAFQKSLTYHTLIHEDMKKFFEGFPPTAHPMAIMSAMTVSLSAYYPDLLDPEVVDLNIARLLAKAKTLAAFAYKKSIGQPYIYPRNDLNYTEDFLHMMFAVPAEPYKVSPVIARALDLLLILHADHEQNCSTSTVRMVGSSQANLFASIASGISALWGPLHGGANQEVINMLEMIHRDGGDYKKYMDMAKDKESGFRLMGFGHRVYKNFDPRARILKKAADDVLDELGVNDPLLGIAKNLEEIALADSYFVERKLYPNVDFYSGIIYRALGIPTDMFTVMFVLGRMPGWIAQWKEMREDPATRINRPRQVYSGATERDYTPVTSR
ncbi:MAG: citrate synthase [Chloroflexi bacterium]|jgi:citrate synthase|nr:MAG: citrate synthase [Chloroflexi bacterium OLB13]MBC6955246.1 citrate synthase [Chloroflexota bacterium]MBV6434928.1 Citrate synthase 1 [Anaerolineae bacterium]MDL1916264.1 citrate synthase [Anaerolineae bacterium CFX4]OQY81841.1 MAG: citrate (Si)-synthase [Anaerolineae bacterium UTCFX5]